MRKKVNKRTGFMIVIDVVSIFSKIVGGKKLKENFTGENKVPSVASSYFISKMT